MAKPSFTGAWAAFTAVRLSVAGVGQKIGGNVQKNIDAKIFQNACPIRMSYVLNMTGFPIRKGSGYETVSGGDKRLYLFRVNEMMEYLRREFGKPDKTISSPKLADFANMKGILVVQGHGWSNARGHITLWDGTRCSDTCHLMYDPENGPFVPGTAALWVLK
jgi:hypothetical protein